MHEKRAHVSFMHSVEALPQAQGEYMKRQCAQPGAPSLTCRSPFEIVVVFRLNDLLALMLNFQTPGGSGQVMSCGLQVRVELKHSKTQTLKHFSVPFSGL